MFSDVFITKVFIFIVSTAIFNSFVFVLNLKYNPKCQGQSKKLKSIFETAKTTFLRLIAEKEALPKRISFEKSEFVPEVNTMANSNKEIEFFQDVVESLEQVKLSQSSAKKNRSKRKKSWFSPQVKYFAIPFVGVYISGWTVVGYNQGWFG